MNIKDDTLHITLKKTASSGQNMKTIKISDQTHAKLTRVVGQLTAKSGKIKTYEDAICTLLYKYEKKVTIT